MEERAREVAESVTDPELPVLTLADLGVLRSVEVEDGRVVVAITPTYSGCPALGAMRDDLTRSLVAAGFADPVIRIVLDPPWTTDWISERGRAALSSYGISPPGPAPAGPVPLTLSPIRREVRCPQCGSERTRLASEFGSTPCKALYRCDFCQESFEHIKEI